MVLILMYFLYLIGDIVTILFVSLVFASAVDPWVDWMQEHKVPRAVGIILIYVGLFSVLGTVVYLMIPPIIEQVRQLSTDFPRYVDRLLSGVSLLREYSVQFGLMDNIKNSIGGLNSNINSAASGFFTTISSFVGGVFSFFLVLVVTFYMVVEENAIKKLVWTIAPSRHQSYIMQLVNRMQKKIGLWLRGQLILSLVIFVLTYTALLILDVKYALVLALFAGLTEFVPYLGPLLGAVPAVFLAFTQSPTLGLMVAAIYYVIQLVENNILVPKVMQKAVGMNPIVSISALLIGFKLAGVMGAILSIPVATAISVFIKDLFEFKEQADQNGDKQ
jgi:predicted PurR-regulated permease PerM